MAQAQDTTGCPAMHSRTDENKSIFLILEDYLGANFEKFHMPVYERGLV